MSQPTIAFIGLGQMGAPMARNLLKAGYAVGGHDRDASIATRFSDSASFAWCASAADAVRGADLVILMLPDSTIVDHVLWQGESALSARMTPGALVIDMSSSDPMCSRENAKKLKVLDLGFIDAPVSGGVKKAEAGTLAIMMGGEAASVERARPVLETMGKTLTHVGEAGAGHAVKALNNYVSAAGLLAVCEALAAAEKFGINPHLVNQVFNASTGKNNTTKNKVEAFMLNGAFNSGFALALMKKDLETANRFIGQVESGAEFSRHCLQIWTDANAQLEPDADHTMMYLYIQKQLGC
jgi:3-hydroxyisobutyrate dehydrogenase